MKNLFITFEGIDGSGKDTLISNFILMARERKFNFISKYEPIWVTREPTRITKFGNKLNDSLLGDEKLSPYDMANYFILDRIEHSKIIRDFLKYSFVLSSRYDFSTLTYQLNQGLDLNKLFSMHRYDLEDGCLIPDLTIVILVDLEVSLKRIFKNRESSKIEIFENKKFLSSLINCQNRVIDFLRERGRNIILLDGNKSKEEVCSEMVEKLNSFFNNSM